MEITHYGNTIQLELNPLAEYFRVITTLNVIEMWRGCVVVAWDQYTLVTPTRKKRVVVVVVVAANNNNNNNINDDDDNDYKTRKTKDGDNIQQDKAPSPCRLLC